VEISGVKAQAGRNDALLIGPEVEIAADELRALIDPDCLGIADAPTTALKGSNNILPGS
jgi:hypothetical protein